MSKTKRLCLYLHTHWDREWYSTFEEYRTQLTFVVDEILGDLESGKLPSFMLDGQSCVLEDLQQVEPRLTERIAALMAAGKMEAGPWYVLADQLLVSGESLLRNLEMGLAVTRRFGQPSMIGYCPDTFGHSQDLPRILQSYGIKTAIVWRGVPDLAGDSLFWWVSPDGSRVLTYHLAKGYYQTAFFENRTAENLAEHLLGWRQSDLPVQAEKTQAQPFDAVLVPVGGDHLSAPRGFTTQLQSARLLTKMESLAVASGEREHAVASGERGHTNDEGLIEANSLRRFVELMLRYAGGKGSKLPSLASELRDNRAAFQHERAYMLQGVLSTRLYLKRDNRLSERRISRILEPVFALLHAEKLVDYPWSQLNFAWRLLMQNHPHDSICGCSIDGVHREMLQRTGKFNQVLNVLERRAGELLTNPGGRLEESADLAFRASMQQPLLVDPDCMTEEITVFNVTGDDSSAPVPFSWCELPAGSAAATPGTQLQENGSIEQDDSIIQLSERELRPLIFTGTNQIPETKQVIINRGWIASKRSIPAFGHSRLSFLPKSAKVLAPLLAVENPDELTTAEGARLSQKSGDQKSISVSNGRLTVEVSAAGELAVTVPGGQPGDPGQKFALNHTLRDLGDGGDTYNFDPLENDSYLQARCIEVLPGRPGPIVASILIKYELGIPQGMESEIGVDLEVENGEAKALPLQRKIRSAHHIPHIFVTEVELRKSTPIVFFETRWENKSTDHRLEVFLDTGAPVQKVFSENHFSIVERVIDNSAPQLPVAKGTEAPLDRYPCQRFFVANGQVFFNEGLPEFGAADSSVSITILRAVSALSRADLRSRGGGAGPAMPTPEANCLGLNRVNYGWAPLPSETRHAKAQNQPSTEVTTSAAEVDIIAAYALAEQFENLSWATFAPVPGESRSSARIENAAVRIVASRVISSNELIEYRLLNTTMQPQEAEFFTSVSHCEALLTTADGRVIEILNALKDEESISTSYAPDAQDYLSRATYKIELGSNALVSIRLRLKSARVNDLKTRAGS